MKWLGAGVLGLLFGLAFSAFFASGCGCPVGSDHPKLIGGTVYELDQPDLGTSDYVLRVSDDGRSFIETFTQNGKHYELRYEVGERTEWG